MQKITMSNYAGGIQEASGPNDFSDRQWAQLKGFIPESDAAFESQWACQRIGGTGDFQFVIPIPSTAGTFLVGVKAPGAPAAGTIWWAKAPASNDTYVDAGNVVWTQFVTAQNRGYSRGNNDPAAQPVIPILPNENYRFITYLSFPAYKFVKQPTTDNGYFYPRDSNAGTTNPKSPLPAILLHGRRPRGSAFSFQTVKQQAIIVYIDVEANGGAGQPFVATFPNWRRMYQRTDRPPGTGSFWTGPTSPTSPKFAEYPLGSLTVATPTFNTRYPSVLTPAQSPTLLPNDNTDHHPYSHVTEDGALAPGRGVIPRGNVGTMLNELLVIGDIEWSDEDSFRAQGQSTDGPTTYSNGVNYFSMRDENTSPHRSSFYFSLGDVDQFDPRGVLSAGGTGTTILGMHQLGDQLIIITEAGAESDGVVVYRGSIEEAVNYSRDANPFAFEREVIMGGIGGFARDDSQVGHRAFSTLWGETNTVVFVDDMGSVWAINGETGDRLDRYGPLPPRRGSADNHVAAVGKHLFVWRDERLLCFTALDASDDQAFGCWTELIPPSANVRSMYGANEELYFISNGEVWRYTKAGPRSERGHLHGQPADLIVSTRTIGEPDELSRKHWHRFSVTFETIGGGELVSLKSRNTSARADATATATHTVTVNKAVTDGEGRVIVPAGIGSQTLVSGTAIFRGDIRLQEFAFWFTGGNPAR
jgi:hypothetical protein